VIIEPKQKMAILKNDRQTCKQQKKKKRKKFKKQQVEKKNNFKK
jgi:hypothetical protein